VADLIQQELMPGFAGFGQESTMELSRIGVDLARIVYQLHGVDRFGETAWKRRLKRHQWLKVLLDKTEPGCVRVQAGGAEALEFTSCRDPVLAGRCREWPAHYFRSLLQGLWADLLALDDRVREMYKTIKRLAKSNEDCVRLQQLRGIGPMTSTTMEQEWW